MSEATSADDDEDDLFDLRDERPLARSRRGLPWLRMALFSALSIATLAYFAKLERTEHTAVSPIPVPATVLIAPPPAWKPLHPANTPYAVDKTLGPAIATARQHSAGGREDTLVIGGLGEPLYARVAFSHGVPTTPRSFYVDIVRRAAEAGLSVERNAQTAMLTTKFGPVESAAVTLAGPVAQECQAFRFHNPDAAFGFQGWLCGLDARPIERAHLACFVDALALAGPADAPLKALFARSDKAQQQNCPPPALTASAVRPPSRP